MPRTLDLAPNARGVSTFPAATALVWQGVGRESVAIAVPGVGLAAGEVLVSIESALVCPLDVQLATGARPGHPPVVLGHDAVGSVVALGEGGARTVEGRRLQVGDRVVWQREVPCRHCAACRRGEPCPRAVRYGAERIRRGWELSGAFATHNHLMAGTRISSAPADDWTMALTCPHLQLGPEVARFPLNEVDAALGVAALQPGLRIVIAPR